MHRQLILAADEDALDLLTRALSVLATRLSREGHRCRPRIVQHGPGRIDVLLDRPTLPAVEGWRPESDGAVWVLDEPVAEVNRTWMAPAPLLVTLGQPDQDGQIYLDLEAVGVTSIIGDPQLRLALIRTFVTELAHSPLAETAQILLVGNLGVPALLEFDSVTAVETWDDVLADLETRAIQSRQTLLTLGQPNCFVARGDRPQDDAFVPLLILADDPPDDPEALAFLHESPSAAAAVVVADVPLPGSTIIECQDDALLLPQYRLCCQPQPLDEEELDGIADLLRSADQSSGVQLTC